MSYLIYSLRVRDPNSIDVGGYFKSRTILFNTEAARDKALEYLVTINPHYSEPRSLLLPSGNISDLGGTEELRVYESLDEFKDTYKDELTASALGKLSEAEKKAVGLIPMVESDSVS